MNMKYSVSKGCVVYYLIDAAKVNVDGAEEKRW